LAMRRRMEILSESAPIPQFLGCIAPVISSHNPKILTTGTVCANEIF
jgi:hypothetical protein